MALIAGRGGRRCRRDRAWLSTKDVADDQGGYSVSYLNVGRRSRHQSPMITQSANRTDVDSSVPGRPRSRWKNWDLPARHQKNSQRDFRTKSRSAPRAATGERPRATAESGPSSSRGTAGEPWPEPGVALPAEYVHTTIQPRLASRRENVIVVHGGGVDG